MRTFFSASAPLSLVLVLVLAPAACGGVPAVATAPSAPAAPTAETSSANAPIPSKPTTSESAPTAVPITSVSVYVSNECDKPVAYCVEDVSSLSTSLSPRASTTHNLKPGARLREKSGSSCGNVTFTVPASKDDVKFSICKK